MRRLNTDIVHRSERMYHAGGPAAILRLPTFSRNVLRLIRDCIWCGPPRPSRERTLGVDVPPYCVSVNAQLARHPTNGHALPLGLLHCLTHLPLEKGQLPRRGGYRHFNHVIFFYGRAFVHCCGYLSVRRLGSRVPRCIPAERTKARFFTDTFPPPSRAKAQKTAGGRFGAQQYQKETATERPRPKRPSLRPKPAGSMREPEIKSQNGRSTRGKSDGNLEKSGGARTALMLPVPNSGSCEVCTEKLRSAPPPDVKDRNPNEKPTARATRKRGTARTAHSERTRIP